jgi:hypothetical protein
MWKIDIHVMKITDYVSIVILLSFNRRIGEWLKKLTTPIRRLKDTKNIFKFDKLKKLKNKIEIIKHIVLE